MQFYSEADIDEKGRVKSEMPSWYNPQMIEEMRNKVRAAETELSMGWVPKGYEPEARERLEKLRSSLSKVENLTRVEEGSNDRDAIAKATKEIGRLIASALPTNRDMEKRIVNAHEEVRRMTTPCISVKGNDLLIDLCRASNVPIYDNGCVTREGAVKAWKIGSKFIGENSNVEVLRK